VTALNRRQTYVSQTVGSFGSLMSLDAIICGSGETPGSSETSFPGSMNRSGVSWPGSGRTCRAHSHGESLFKQAIFHRARLRGPPTNKFVAESIQLLLSEYALGRPLLALG
jgi:hypothetical protein